MLNDRAVDGFELQHVPAGHKDYFHQMPYPDLPQVEPFSLCANLYVWKVPRSHLNIRGAQRLTIRLSRDAKWDIDYVGFLFKRPPRTGTVFISYTSNDRPIARRLGAVHK